MADVNWKNKLFFGDNLAVLRKDIPDECVDLEVLWSLPIDHNPLRVVDPQLATVHPVTAPLQGITLQIPHVAHNQGLRPVVGHLEDSDLNPQIDDRELQFPKHLSRPFIV